MHRVQPLMRVGALLVVLALTPGGVNAQPLVVGPNVNISTIAGPQSEVGIAVNPTNPLNLVAVSNDIADLSRLATWRSFDRGATWTANFIDDTEDGFGANDSRFDPNVAFDSDGNVYVVYSTTGTGNRILVARSTDGGQNFNQVTTVTTDTGQGVCGGGANNGTQCTADSECPGGLCVRSNLHTAMVTARADAGGPDDVLVVWARPQAGGESIEAALSLDAGATFPTTNNNINDALQRTFLPWASVDAAGDFHVVWEVNQGGGAGAIFHDTLDSATLADGANTTVTAVQITDFAAATSLIPPQPDRGVFSVSTVDVDRTSGRVYVAYTNRASTASNDTNIFVRSSVDGGANWSAPVQVNDDATTTSQFLPRMAIDQTTGVVYATWYDARNDATNNQQVDVFASTSVDGGVTWSANQRLTTARSDESTANAARDSNNYGEYFGLIAYQCVAHATWTDARAANFTGGTNEDVYTTRVIFTTGQCAADLAISKTDDPDPVRAGKQLAYEISVKNNGPGVAYNTVVTDVLPPGVTFISDTDACVEGPVGTLTCSLGDVAVGATQTFTVTVKVDPGLVIPPALNTFITNRADVASDVVDPDPTNNTVEQTTEVLARLSHYMCYEVRRAPRFAGLSDVTLDDQFGASVVDVGRRTRLCNPADKKDEDPTALLDPEHLVSYEIDQTSAPFETIRHLHVINQFGEFAIDLVRPNQILVPTAKDPAAAPPPLVDSLVDHFKCYRVTGARTRVAGLKVDDQFGTLSVDVKRPDELCVPADKNAGGLIDDSASLLCYHIRSDPRRQLNGVSFFINNQFEEAKVVITGPRELCVPTAMVADDD